MGEIVRLGAPVRPVDVQGKIEFNSQFFEPHGTFHARIYYAARYADMDLTISHPVGRWQIDEIAFLPQREQPAAPAPGARRLLRPPRRLQLHLQESLQRKRHLQRQLRLALEAKRRQPRASHRGAATETSGRVNPDKSVTRSPWSRGARTTRLSSETSGQ